MAIKKRKIVKTLYVEYIGSPLRLELTQDLLDRVKKLQEIVSGLPLKRNEEVEVEITLRKGIIQIRKAYIDIGEYGYEGWNSYIIGLDLKSLDNLPKVYFSSVFLFYLKNPLLVGGRKGAFSKVILPRHKELLVWKKIEGTA